MEIADFSAATDTIIISDLHLADAEPPHPRNPLWKRFKRKKYFIDRSFKDFLEEIQKKTPNKIELILNGDIFDFDSVTEIPPKKRPFRVNWLEKKCGLNSEEQKSRYKISVILRDHDVWVDALRGFLLNGNRVIFVIGNHDMELHWPGVQEDILHTLDVPHEFRQNVRFCEWFYISNKDTLIEHGNQYDAYCVCSNPVHPLVREGFGVFVRLPFGNLAGRYMVNNMGLINPHVESNYIMGLGQWLVFFFKYFIRVQPQIAWTWFWTAGVTLFLSIGEGLLPAIKDPLTTEARVENIASKANAAPYMVRALRELHEHPAIFSPIKILQELWLDRALLLGALLFVSFWIFSVLNLITPVSIYWFVGIFLVFFPLLIYYAASVKSDVYAFQDKAIENIPIAAQITKVSRVIHGHTHRPIHSEVQGVEVANTGTWSPAFKDPKCMEKYSIECFAWIKPKSDGLSREVKLMVWKNHSFHEISKAAAVEAHK